DPIAILDRAAIATAPFPLPKTSSTVKQFWTYKRSAGDIPTFPVTTYQYYIFKAVYPEILQILQKINPLLSAELPKNLQQLTSDYKTIEIFQKIQAVFDNATLSEEFTRLLKTANYPTEKLRLLESWLFFLNSADSLYLNHYGKAGTITTIPFYQALVMDILNPQLFQNKVVLVGYSETIEPEKNQGFYNGFSDKQSVSAIEIAANAVANLIDNNWLKPLSSSAQFILILCWGILLSTIFRLCAYKLANRTVIFLSFLYSLFSYYQFADANVWIPLTIPLLQTVAIILLESVTHLAQVRKVSERYLPEHVFNTNLKNPDGMNQYGNIMHGVCMATDAGQYTTLSETMRPLELNVLMNNYYAAMFPQVKKYRGIISDVIGDAMMAIWAKPDINKQVRIDACHAALAIQASINAFNQSQQHQLPTRFGLHYGEMRLGNVGAIEHYEYRAVGDCINTASRIENLNKTLGTRILVSAVVIDGLTQFVSREIGAFILKGKTQALTVFELLDCNQEDCQTLLAAFSQALKLFQSRQWQQAEQAFQAIIDAYPEDGPSRFYLHHLNNLPTCPAMHENANQPVVIEIA
ncbi:MAG: adenylate/guanylate cyclase domain-containing protein, partial [Methylococcales bacterium]